MEIRLSVVDPARSALTVDVRRPGPRRLHAGRRRRRPARGGRARGPGAARCSATASSCPPTPRSARSRCSRAPCSASAAPAVRPDASPGTVGGFLELHSVGGPDAGLVYRLTPGRHRIGRAGEAVLTVDDPDVSRVHAELSVTPAGITRARPRVHQRHRRRRPPPRRAAGAAHRAVPSARGLDHPEAAGAAGRAGRGGRARRPGRGQPVAADRPAGAGRHAAAAGAPAAAPQRAGAGRGDGRPARPGRAARPAAAAPGTTCSSACCRR